MSQPRQCIHLTEKTNINNRKMKNLIIIGAGGMGRQVCLFAQECKGFEKEYVIKGFLDDNPHAMEGFDG